MTFHTSGSRIDIILNRRASRNLPMAATAMYVAFSGKRGMIRKNEKSPVSGAMEGMK